jgi:hypothetical protein
MRPTHAHYVARHAERVRGAGGTRTTVDLTAQALEALAKLRQAGRYRSNSEAICAALTALAGA